MHSVQDQVDVCDFGEKVPDLIGSPRDACQEAIPVSQDLTAELHELGDTRDCSYSFHLWQAMVQIDGFDVDEGDERSVV